MGIAWGYCGDPERRAMTSGSWSHDFDAAPHNRTIDIWASEDGRAPKRFPDCYWNAHMECFADSGGYAMRRPWWRLIAWMVPVEGPRE
jgi:hypothetical protein